MPLGTIGAFNQLAVEPGPTPWMRREANGEPRLKKVHERRCLSIQDRVPITDQQHTGTVREEGEFFVEVVKQDFANPDPTSQTNLPRLGRFPQRVLPTAVDEDERIRENLTYLVVRDLIERDKIGAARELLSGLPLDYLSDPLVLRLLKTLAPPISKQSKKQDIDRQKDYAWLRDHGREYAGHWLALDDGRLFAVAATLRDTRAKVKALRLSRPPLLHQVK